MIRRVFNKLHEEVSLSLGKAYNRYYLWLSVSEYGYDPEDLQPSEASNWCRDNGFLSVAGRMASYDPSIETPEEIMERICGS